MADQRSVVRRTIARGVGVTIISNLLAAAAVSTLLFVVLPRPDEADDAIVPGIITGAVVGSVFLVLGSWAGIRIATRRTRWLQRGREPSPADRQATIGIPLAIARLQALLWVAAAAILWIVTSRWSGLLGVEVALTVLLGGLSSGGATYLWVERVHRPVVVEALRGATIRAPRGAGVAARTLIFWLLGTGLPLAGLTLLGGLAIGLPVTSTELAVAVLVLGLIALIGGAVTMASLARSVAEPLGELRRATTALGEGGVRTRLSVTDGGEVGVLQSAFNAMLDGLDERDRIRELFGRHVGAEVARVALEEGVQLGGEVRHVAVLFVDVTGSVALADDGQPHTVVEQLNHVFGIVVEEVEAAGGVVTTYAGDAVVSVWGAPVSHDTPAATALRTARAVQARLDDEGAVAAGVGVADGPVVAGNIGAASRVEYTVIGDAVNVAARLCELAKQDGTVASAHPVLATAAMLDEAADEAACWEPAGEEVLRGRSSATALVRPVRDLDGGPSTAPTRTSSSPDERAAQPSGR